MITTLNNAHHVPYNNEKSAVALEETSSFSKRFKQISSTFESSWSYIGKILLATRHFLNGASRDVDAIAIFGKNFTQGIANNVIRLKLFSIVSVPFGMKDTYGVFEKIIAGLNLKDVEGVALNSLSITIILADVVDSITTFLNAASTLIVGSSIQAFASLGLPLGFTIPGVGTISRTIQVVKSLGLYKNVQDQLLNNKNVNKDSLKAFLESTLGISKELKELLAVPKDQLSSEQKEQIEILKEKSKQAILRSATPDIVNDLEDLLRFVDMEINSDSLENQRHVEKILNRIQNQLLRKVKTHLFGIIANLFSLAALSLFAVGFASSLPFFLLSVSFAIRLLGVMHQNNKF